MPSRKPSRPWKLLRIYFRRFRIGVWLCVLLICGALLYVNQVGLPDFVKNPVLERLQARGLHLQFTRLRWHFPYGIVADNVLFGGGTNAATPVFTVREVQVKLDYRALLHRQLQVDSLVLNQGRFAWQLNESNRPPRDFLVENIQTELRLLPGDLWRLDHFRAQFAGAGIRLSGLVTNASAIRDWKLFQPDPAGRAESGDTLQKNLRRVAEVFDRIHFATTPELTVDIDGDARRLPDFAVRVTLRADDASTPWGDFDRVVFSARAQPKENDEPTQCEIVLRAAGARTPWAMAEDVELTMHALSNAATNFNADLNCTAARVGSEWGNGTRLRFAAKWRHSVTNAIPRSGTGRLQLEVAETPWGVGRDLDVAATLTTLTNLTSEPGSASAWWMDLSPYELQVESRLAAFAAVQLRATNVVCSANWRAPQLTVQRLSADLQDGQLALQGGLDAGTHEVSFHVTSGCSPQKFPLLQKYFKDVQFVVPPQLDVSGTVQLPSTDRGLESWLNEAWADTKLAGRLSFNQATFRGTAFESARVQFSRTNQAWDVPDLRVVRPEGGLESSFQFDERTGDLALKLHSRLDLNVARAFLSPADQEPLDLARFTEPPEISASVQVPAGRWERLNMRGELALTNFSFRGQTAGVVLTGFEFTNRFLSLRSLQVERGVDERIQAESIGVDFAREKIYLNKVRGHADPLAVARAIGPVAGAWFEPYQFLETPDARINGSISFDIDNGVDLHFDFEGRAFKWWLIRLARVTGRVDWVDDNLALNNVVAEFYGGTAEGGAAFHFPKGPGTDLRFKVNVANANLHLLLNDLNPQTNQLAGLLSGYWSVTEGNAPEVSTWKGSGRVSLREGRIMEIPVFGVLSPALDSLAPGLGSNRLSDGTASFVLTNGVVHSDDLDIRASGMRLLYRGDVDLEGRVNARAEAELLRDTWMLGKVLSLALWPVSKAFEYKISGTLGNPKMEPLYFLPKLILMPLHPLETMRELRSKPAESDATNAPPADVKP